MKYLFSRHNHDISFRELLIDPATNTWYKVGDTIKNPKLARTLKIIQQNPMDFYNGSLAKEIVDDLTEHGGIITLEDLKNYEVAERKPLTTTVKGMKYHLIWCIICLCSLNSFDFIVLIL